MRVLSARVITEPAAEPIDIQEAKDHLRVTGSAEDALIERLITVARQQCELVAHRAFVTQTLVATLDAWPKDDVIELPRAPLQSVTGITYTDSGGTDHLWDSDQYIVDTVSEPGRIALAYGATWPTATLQPRAGIRIEFVAGYGDAVDVPSTYKQAILLLLGHLYENREMVVVQQGVTTITVPNSVLWLLFADRG